MQKSQVEPQTGKPDPPPPATGRVAIGTLSRLLVGSALLGWDVMMTALQAEDADLAGEESTQSEEPADVSPTGAPDGEADARARQALIGLVFDTGERAVRSGGSAVGVAARTTRALTGPAARWAGRSRLLAPARRRYESLVERGESELERWVERGRAEEARSRALLQTALIQTVDTSMDYVIDNPKVQELVAEQSTSVAQEVVEELRERAVSMDLLVERLVGWVLRRPHRRTQAPVVIVAGPVEEAGGAAQSLAGQPAGYVSRLIAFVIDVIVITVAFVATGWLLDAVRTVLGAGMVLSRTLGSIPEITYGGLLVSGTTLFWMGYLILFWTVSGKTPGKAILGLRVVTRDGKGLSLGRSMLRVVGYVFSALVFYLGFLWVAVDARQRGWHDYLAGTYVVYSWDAHPEEHFLADEREALTPERSKDAE